jgi:hypothetical protein
MGRRTLENAHKETTTTYNVTLTANRKKIHFSSDPQIDTTIAIDSTPCIGNWERGDHSPLTIQSIDRRYQSNEIELLRSMMLC